MVSTLDETNACTILEACQLFESAAGPKSEVFTCNPLFYPFCILHVLTCKSIGCSPKCECTLEAYVISHQQSCFDIDRSCCSLIEILRKSFICAPQTCACAR